MRTVDETVHHGLGEHLVRGREAGRFRRDAIDVIYQCVEVAGIVHGFCREGVDRDAAVSAKEAVAQSGRQLFRGEGLGLPPGVDDFETGIRSG